MHPVYHLDHGWFFQRTDDPAGSVRIFKRADSTPVSPIECEITMLPEEWASIVAFVSKGGETATNHARALSLHNGEPYIC